jgi:hypothetical protein
MECPACGKPSRKFSIFLELSLPIPPKVQAQATLSLQRQPPQFTTVSMTELFDFFTAIETLDEKNLWYVNRFLFSLSRYVYFSDIFFLHTGQELFLLQYEGEGKERIPDSRSSPTPCDSLGSFQQLALQSDSLCRT